MTLVLRELYDLTLTRILLTPTTTGVQRVRKVLTSHNLICLFLLRCEQISCQRTHLLIVVRFTLCVIRRLLSICALRVIRGEFVIPMKDHGKHEFELAADHRPQRPLRYGLLVLSQQVLKALVEDGLDLIQLKQLRVSIEELVECLVEQLEGNLVRLLPSIVHLVTLAILTYADEGCDVW